MPTRSLAGQAGAQYEEAEHVADSMMPSRTTGRLQDGRNLDRHSFPTVESTSLEYIEKNQTQSTNARDLSDESDFQPGQNTEKGEIGPGGEADVSNESPSGASEGQSAYAPEGAEPDFPNELPLPSPAVNDRFGVEPSAISFEPIPDAEIATSQQDETDKTTETNIALEPGVSTELASPSQDVNEKYDVEPSDAAFEPATEADNAALQPDRAPEMAKTDAVPKNDVSNESSSLSRDANKRTGVDAAEASPEQTTDAESAPDASVLVVRDTAEEVGLGQMKRSEFLSQLQTAVRNTAEESLSGTGRSARDCPYIEYWFGYYAFQDSRHIERSMHRYAPETAQATTAEEAILMITERVRRAVEVWATSGEVTGVPEGVPTNLPGAKTADNSGGAASKEGNVFFKAREGGPKNPAAPHAIQSQLDAGGALDHRVRSRMDSAFGYDFSDVRVHTDAKAARLSSSLNARAFTIGNDIAFGAGEYQPGSWVGDALLAHELAHVVQQGGAVSSGTELPNWGSESNALEEDADVSAVGAVFSTRNWPTQGLASIAHNAMPRLRSGLRLQRCSKSTPPPGPAAVTISTTPVVIPASVLAVLPAGVPAVSGPVHRNWGEYLECVGWQTSGRNGFIVQELTNTMAPTACTAGAALGPMPTPHYWEAWGASASGNVTPAVGSANDVFYRSARPSTSGNWAMDARVYWVSSLDPAAGFSANNPSVPDAGMLLATTTAPTNLGTSLLTRHAGGTWDCTGAHTAA